MKKRFFKFNMAIIVVMILFANTITCFASTFDVDYSAETPVDTGDGVYYEKIFSFDITSADIDADNCISINYTGDPGISEMYILWNSQFMNANDFSAFELHDSSGTLIESRDDNQELSSGGVSDQWANSGAAYYDIEKEYGLPQSSTRGLGEGYPIFNTSTGEYKIKLDDAIVDSINRGENATLVLHTLTTATNGTSQQQLMNQQTEDPKTWFEQIEEVMATFVMSLAKVIQYIINSSLGRTLTMDDIVFNKFTQVRLDFFYTDINGDEVTGVDSLVNDLREPVTVMYNLFKNMAIVGYLIIIVYIGIRIMLDSTTAKGKAKYKETFLAWVTGIMILFLMPYYMKYIIAFDDSLVQFMCNDTSLRSVRAINAESAKFNPEADKGYIETKFEKTDDSAEVIDFSPRENESYMDAVGRIANDDKKLGYSIAYLIMTWQVIILVVYYYKRTFVVALLIMIFPLIAFSYVWDKLNDGRSQALSSWTKEFTINVLVQVFHAIIMIFVGNTIYSTLNYNSADFILLIIASSFLFAGEDVMKSIFGGGGDSLGSAKNTGAKLAAMTGVAISAGQRITYNLVGEKGMVRSTIRDFNRFRKDRFLLKKDKDGISFFDKIASAPAAARRINELMPSEGNVSPKIAQAAETIDTLNNMDKKSPEEIARALNNYEKLLAARNGEGYEPMTEEEKRQFDAMMRKCNLSPAQLQRISTAMAKASQEYDNVVTTGMARDKSIKRITQTLRMEVEAVYEVDGKISNSDRVAAERVVLASLINMTEGKDKDSTVKDSFRAAVNSKIEPVKEFHKNINFAMGTERFETKWQSGSKSIDIEAVREEHRKMVTKRDNRTKDIIRDYREATGQNNVSSDYKKCAKYIATLEQLSDQTVNVKEAMHALNVLSENKEVANELLKYSDIQLDVDTLQLIVADKIKNMPTEKGKEKLIDGRAVLEADAKAYEEYNETLARMERGEIPYSEERLNALKQAAEGEHQRLVQQSQQDVEKARKWADDVIRDVNTNIGRLGDKNIVEEDPVVLINEIIYMHQKKNKNGRVDNLESVFENDISGELYDVKFKLGKLEAENARLRNQAFATEALAALGYTKHDLGADFRTMFNSDYRDEKRRRTSEQLRDGFMAPDRDSFAPEYAYTERGRRKKNASTASGTYVGTDGRVHRVDEGSNRRLTADKVFMGNDGTFHTTHGHKLSAVRAFIGSDGKVYATDGRKIRLVEGVDDLSRTAGMPVGGHTPAGPTPRGATRRTSRGRTPGGVAPGGVAPGGVAPGGVAPGGVAPGGVAPGGVAPGGVAPGGVAPGGVALGGVAPGGVAPGGVAPGGTSTSGTAGATGTTVKLFVGENGKVYADDRRRTLNIDQEVNLFMDENGKIYSVSSHETGFTSTEGSSAGEKMVAYDLNPIESGFLIDGEESIENQAERAARQRKSRISTSLRDYLGQTEEDAKAQRGTRLFQDEDRSTGNSEDERNSWGRSRYVGRYQEDATERLFADEERNENGYIDFDPYADERGTVRRKLSEVGNFAKHIGENLAYDASKKLDKQPEYEQPTYNGLTKDDVKKQLVNDTITFWAHDSANNVIGIITDLIIAPTATIAGAAVGAALTEDGMPIGEVFGGALSGYKLASKISDNKIIPALSGENSREEQRRRIIQMQQKRIQAQEKERAEARRRAEDELNGTTPADARDLSLSLSIATVDLHQEVDGTLSGTVSVRAENASYIRVSEVEGGGNWMPFQESVLHRFTDPNPHNAHQLYVYVSDKDGNVKGVRISEIKL